MSEIENNKNIYKLSNIKTCDVILSIYGVIVI
jgi:hypothetical protein